jgi:hypothetical protein
MRRIADKQASDGAVKLKEGSNERSDSRLLDPIEHGYDHRC